MQRAGDDLGEAAGGDVLGLVLGIGTDGGQQGLSLVRNTAADADDLRLKGVDDVGDADTDILIQLSTTLLATVAPLAAASKESFWR